MVNGEGWQQGWAMTAPKVCNAFSDKIEGWIDIRRIGVRRYGARDQSSNTAFTR